MLERSKYQTHRLGRILSPIRALIRVLVRLSAESKSSRPREVLKIHLPVRETPVPRSVKFVSWITFRKGSHVPPYRNHGCHNWSLMRRIRRAFHEMRGRRRFQRDHSRGTVWLVESAARALQIVLAPLAAAKKTLWYADSESFCYLFHSTR